MAPTESTMLPLGTEAPVFRLPDTAGRFVSLDNFAGSPALLVMFICNHCPYVRHIVPEIRRLTDECQARGVSVVAISSNDVARYPEDGPGPMREFARQHRFGFPYLCDETQAVARAYRAACTPDFYVFDAARRLVYRGQFDGARPGNEVPVTGHDLRAALDAVLSGGVVLQEQRPSLGCSIKWKDGIEPDYAVSEDKRRQPAS